MFCYGFYLAAMLQETRFSETGLQEFMSSDGKKVCLYNSEKGAQSIGEVEIITAESTNVTFNPLSERICIITTKTSDNIKCRVTSTYAPPLQNTMRNPDERHISYEQLSSLINSI